MDYLRGNICWEEQGSFVYEVVADLVTVRTNPSVNEHYKTDIRFLKGDLVSIDLVRPSRAPSDGPYLRLSDGSGWLLEQQHDSNKAALTRRAVEAGLWTFFIDNFPLGQALIRHPVANRLDLVLSPQVYPPMRRIYCDRRVTSSTRKIEFFRVQGTKGWIVGRGLTTSKKKATSMLLPENQVKSGVFGFQCLKPTPVHLGPTRRRDSGSKTALTIGTNQLVVANLTREGSDGSISARLVDGSGWIPLQNKAGEKYVERIPIVSGSWKLLCVSSSPVRLLRQPLDRDDMICESKTTYKLDSQIECDERIASGKNGVVFYKVKGTEGFVPVKRGDKTLLKLADDRDNSSDSMGPKEVGWSPDFVRGIASLVQGVYESEHDEHSKILSFSSSSEDRPVIKVYYSTRMVTSYPSEGPCRRNCCPPDLAEILRDPSVLKKQREDKVLPPVKVVDAKNSEIAIGEEEEAALRHQLVACYMKSEKLKMQQLKILQVLKQCDQNRGDRERALEERAEKRMEELKQLELERIKEQQQHHRPRLTCDDIRTKQKHWSKSVYGSHKCVTCGGTFASLNDLMEHRDETGHGSASDDLETSMHTLERSTSSRHTSVTASSNTWATGSSMSSDTDWSL